MQNIATTASAAGPMRWGSTIREKTRRDQDHRGGPTCTDPELVNALSVALKSDWPAGTDPIIHNDRDGCQKL